MKTHYTQHIETAFADTADGNGASCMRFSFWQAALARAIPRLKSKPQKEAESILSLPFRTSDLAEIDAVATYIANHFDTLVVAGMGGSSLSSETLSCLRKPGGLTLRFIDNIDPHSMTMLTETIDWRTAAFLVISKSGHTVETLAHMAVLLRQAKRRLADYAKHFYVITVANNNPLHMLAKTHDMRLVAHDPVLGGRFSILSSVGLIPAAAIGLDIWALRAGAQAVLHENFLQEGKYAPAAESAALHMALMEKNIRMNVFMHYCDRLSGMADWYRQCWGESLGKCSAATTPLRACGATDQHSQLQLYLDGPKDKFFTVMMLENAGQGERIDYDENNDVRFELLKGHTMGDLMAVEQRATVAALVKNDCPVRRFVMRELNEEVLGALLMHFMLEIIFTAQLLNVNAFDQPAVEESKALALHYLSGGSDQPLRTAI